MSIGYETYENENKNNANNTISGAFNIKNKYLNSSIFLNKKEEVLNENVEMDNVNTNVTFYGNTAGNKLIDLQSLKESIEKMSKFHQIEILRILSSSTNVCLNENNNGTFVNLTEQSENIIVELKKYVSYVNEQQSYLSIVENEKCRLEKIFSKDNKDK
jgi:hypothetical protein